MGTFSLDYYKLDEMGTVWWPKEDIFISIYVDHDLIPVFTNEMWFTIGFMF